MTRGWMKLPHVALQRWPSLYLCFVPSSLAANPQYGTTMIVEVNRKDDRKDEAYEKKLQEKDTNIEKSIALVSQVRHFCPELERGCGSGGWVTEAGF